MKRLKISVVDDSISARMLLKQAIQEAIEDDYLIFEAKDGIEAVELYKNETPDIVFMDLTMPNMNGMDALREIRKLNDKAAVVIITADRQKETKKELIADGACDVLNKPVDVQELKDVYQKIIGR
ncbi:MAG: response regulator [Campylobacterales bacterium]|nr:response regulator [Campylobacterales bacterium]